MNTDIPSRRRSASAPFVPHRGPPSARERVLRALELGRRGQMLQVGRSCSIQPRLSRSLSGCVTIEDLVALKLYAGGLSDLADIEQLLAHNPEADLSAIRAVAAPFDDAGRLEALIDRLAQPNARRR